MRREAVFRKPVIWALCFGAWIVLWLLNAGSEIIDVATGDQEFPYWEPIVWEMTSTLAMALLTPFLIEFALRVRFSTTGRAVATAGHLLAMPLFSLLHVGGMVGMRKAIYLMAGDQYRFGHPGWELLYEGFKDSMTYWTIVGLTYGFDYYLRYRRRELQTAKLQTSLARARLENLEHRIQPHFLFNTLNRISTVMREDVDLADRMITRLSDLLRMSTHRRGQREVPLAHELEMLEAYVEIMQARFEERLAVKIKAAPGTEAALVPPLLLQPLVENAIKHGIATKDEGGRIEVDIRRNGSDLLLDVRDDGPGAGVPQEVLLGKGLGLSMTAERLEQMYGDKQELLIRDDERGGLRLSISIPFRTDSGS